MTSTPDSPAPGTLSITRTHIVEWGECDPLGIIFYPNYFRWIDVSSHMLFRQVGHDVHSMREEYGLAGAVIVDTGASFVAPISNGDEIAIEAWVGEWHGKTFRVEHRFRKSGDLVCRGHELRAWAVRDDATPTGFKAGPIPDAFRDLFKL